MYLYTLLAKWAFQGDHPDLQYQFRHQDHRVMNFLLFQSRYRFDDRSLHLLSARIRESRLCCPLFVMQRIISFTLGQDLLNFL